MKSPEKVSGKKQPKSWLPPKEKKEKVNKVENEEPVQMTSTVFTYTIKERHTRDLRPLCNFLI